MKNDFSETAYLTRLMPFPFDFRTLIKAVEEVSTPYLDMQINIPLTILYGVSLFVLLADKNVKNKKKVIAIFLFMCSLMWLVFSSSVRAKVVTDVLFSRVQFAYRLITYIDLFVAIGLLYNLAVVYSNSEIRRTEWIKIAMIVSITLACHNMIIQWTHIYAVHDIVSVETVADHYPSTFMINDYVDYNYLRPPEGEKDKAIKVSFEIDDKLNSRPALLNINEKAMVVTNVQTSKYNEIYANGVGIDTLYFAEDGVFAFYLVPGTYKLEYRNALPSAYLVLRKLGQNAMAILALACCGLYIVILGRKWLRKSENREKNRK